MMHYSRYNKNIDWAVIQNGSAKEAMQVALYAVYHTSNGEFLLERIIDNRWTPTEVAVDILTEITDGWDIDRKSVV